MSNVLVDKNKIDLLANAISAKSGESLTLTLDEMVSAVDGIETGGGGITPTGNINITSAGTTDVTNYATATVPQGDVYPMCLYQYKTVSNERKFEIKPKSIIYTDDNVGTVGYINDNYEKDGEAELFNAIPKNTTITPSTSSQTIGGVNYMMEGAVTVNAVPMASFYSETVPLGYSTENNKRVWKIKAQTELDPNEGDTEGWISAGFYGGGTRTYNAIAQNTTVTPTESAQTIGGADTMMEGAVTVSAIPSNYVGSGITQRSSSDLTASGATVSVPSGYYASNASKAVSSGSATPASTISGTSATVSTGTNTLTLSKTVSNTPQVTAGYVSSGTAGNSSVSLTASVTTKAAATITPTTTNQTISSGTYLTGTQTISGDANLVAGNIKSGTTIFGVTGTYSGGGGSSDVAYGTLNVASNVNTSTSTKITDTSTVGFTPTKFFFWKDSRTATSNHVHQATFTTIGTYYVRTMTRYSSNALSTSGNTNNWTTQTAGYLYYNSNTVYFRSSSSYILSSGTWYWVAVK